MGVPIAILAGGADAGIAAASFGMTISERNLLAFSRVQEQAADQASVELLNKLGMNSDGLTKFMGRLHEQAQLYSSLHADPYLMTHPLTQDRIAFLEHASHISPHRGKELKPIYDYLHQRMRAKILAYQKPHQAIQNYSHHANKEMGLYALSIANMRLSRHDDALEFANQLLLMRPNDPFYMELKADIYRDAGKLGMAIPLYRNAIDKVPWAGLIRINLVQSLLEERSGKIDEMVLNDALEQLDEAKRYEPNMPGLWRNYGIIYAHKKDAGMLALTKAEAAFRTNDLNTANKAANEAMGLLARDGTAYQRARDIINVIELSKS